MTVSSADGWATLEAEARTLYERKMHAANGLTLAEDNRIDGILTIDLPALLAAFRRLRERNEHDVGVMRFAHDLLDHYLHTGELMREEMYAARDALALSSSRRLGEPE